MHEAFSVVSFLSGDRSNGTSPLCSDLNVMQNMKLNRHSQLLAFQDKLLSSGNQTKAVFHIPTQKTARNLFRELDFHATSVRKKLAARTTFVNRKPWFTIVGKSQYFWRLLT